MDSSDGNKGNRKEAGLNKNPEFPLTDLSILRSWCYQQKHLPELKDSELIIFHHSCSYEISKTKSRIQAYFKIRRSKPELFSGRDLTSMPLYAYAQNIVQCFPLGEIQKHDHVIIYRLLTDDAHSHNFNFDYQLLSLAAEVILYKIGTFNSLIILVDFCRARLRHLTRANLSNLCAVVSYLQEGFPARLNAIHIISGSTFMMVGVAAMKPFTNSYVLERMIFHKPNSLDSLYEALPKECLPRDFGGSLECCEKLNKDYIENFTELKNYFEEKDKFEFGSKYESDGSE